MRIRELLSTGKPSISFEFFPPKDETAAQNLGKTIAALHDLKPTYVSVTWGAGGSTRSKTTELVSQIKSEYGTDPMAHLTCVGATEAELREILHKFEESGVENILALRGDPPKGETEFKQTEGGFGYADELTAFIKREFDFCVGGACYPEKHIEAPNEQTDLDNLKRKVDAGADFLVSQLFFDNRLFFDFVGRARRAGIRVPIVPGVMPITNVKQVQRFTKMCGATIPEELHRELERLQDDSNAVLSLGVAHATAQCVELLQKGAPGIHFYTLNKSPATRTILTAMRAVHPPACDPAG